MRAQRSRTVATLLLTALCLCLAETAVHATKPHRREGFFLGLGFGAGVASWDWSDPALGSGPSESSGALGLRAGKALREDLLVGVEVWGWAKRWTIETSSGFEVGKATVSFGSVNVAMTYFPGNRGAFVRAGFGGGMARTEVTDSTAVALGVKPETSDFGASILGAVGYEVRVTDRFALGVQGDLVYIFVDGEVISRPFVADGGIQFSWYW